MKRILKIILLILTIVLNTEQGFTQDSYDLMYQYSMKPYNSKANSKAGNAILHIQGGKSYFADEMLVARAEVSRKEISSQQKINELSQLNRPAFNYEVHKNPNGLTLTERLLTKEYVGYEESLMPFDSWAIYPDTLSILNLPCQKAMIRFGGREWIAWFTDKIPVSDGPYKFRGLPGLIVKIASADADFRFELVQFKKASISLPELPSHTKVSRKKYEELREVSPLLAAQNMDSRFKSMDVKKNGVSISSNEMINELKKDLADRNHIEID
jgi:GLPGLI family protein